MNKSNVTFKLAIILYALWYFTLAFSQSLPVRIYFTDNGLASSQVWDIVEDTRGSIWFGCSSGISRFNGFEFKTYRLKEGLPNESINKLLTSKTGIVIAQTVKGIAYIKPNAKKFTAIPYIGEVSDTIAIDELSKNNSTLRTKTVLFAALKKKGIYRFDIEKNKWHYFGFKKYNPVVLRLFKAKLFFSTSDGNLFVTSLKKDNPKLIGKTPPLIKIKVSKSNTLLLVSKHTIFLYKNGNIKKIFNTPDNEEIIFDCIQDMAENIWIATNQGLRKISETRSSFYSLQNGIPAKRVLSIFQNNEGIIWFGTNHGACKLISEHMLVYKDKTSRSGASYICFYYDKENKAMMLGFSSGVLIAKNGNISTLKSKYISKFPVWDIVKDKKGNFYFATEGGGVIKRDKFGKEQYFTEENKCLPGNNATDLLLNGDTLYVSCKKGFAVMKNNKWKRYDISNGLPVSYIRCLAKDDKNNILLGSLGEGVIIYNRGKFKNYLPSTPKELKSVFALYFDKNRKTLWAATNYGLIKINNNKTKFYGKKNGFLPFGLSAVYPAGKYLWIGSDGGAQLFDPEKETILKILTKDDGLPGNEFTTHNAITKDPDNNIWFGLFGGAVKIENLGLQIDNKTMFKPKIFPTSLRYFYKNKFYENTNFSQKTIKIPYGTKEIFINFDVIWFRNEYSLGIEYKLKGINTMWNRINNFKNMKIYYTTLKPGIYPLYIKVSSISNNKEIIERVMTLEVPEPFWQKPEFIILIFALFLGLIGIIAYTVTHIKTAKLKKEKEILDKLVKDRTKQLDTLNKKLEEKNAKLKEFAEHDYLTGLYNRRFFAHLIKIFKRSAARDEKTNGCFILLDIDHFKKVNDTYGHDAGDTVLKFVAETISSSIRNSDFAIRFGGEEFLVLLTKLDEKNTIEIAFNIAEKIREKIENVTVEYNTKSIKLTVSGGVCCFDFKTLDRETLEQKLKEVDEKLYKAKESGRNRIIK